MGNGRGFQRKLKGQFGHSPNKSKRKNIRRYKNFLKVRAALDSLSKAAQPLLDNTESLANTLKQQTDNQKTDTQPDPHLSSDG